MGAAAGQDHYKFKHGLRKTKEFGIWWQMIQRCRNPKHHAYPRYGGRGIRVCDRWQEFTAFLQDMGPKPEGLQLDRIDKMMEDGKQMAESDWRKPAFDDYTALRQFKLDQIAQARENAAKSLALATRIESELAELDKAAVVFGRRLSG